MDPPGNTGHAPSVLNCSAHSLGFLFVSLSVAFTLFGYSLYLYPF